MVSEINASGMGPSRKFVATRATLALPGPANTPFPDFLATPSPSDSPAPSLAAPVPLVDDLPPRWTLVLIRTDVRPLTSDA